MLARANSLTKQNALHVLLDLCSWVGLIKPQGLENFASRLSSSYRRLDRCVHETQMRLVNKKRKQRVMKMTLQGIE